MTQLQAVIFDWGGTLTPWVTVDHRLGWQQFAAVLHADEPELAEALSTRLREAEDARWACVRDEHTAFTVEHVLADAEVNSTEAALAATASSGCMPRTAGRRPVRCSTCSGSAGSGSGCSRRRRGPPLWHEEWLARDGLLDRFDACVWSSDLPYTKPHRTAFLTAMAAVGVTDPARCV